MTPATHNRQSRQWLQPSAPSIRSRHHRTDGGRDGQLLHHHQRRKQRAGDVAECARGERAEVDNDAPRYMNVEWHLRHGSTVRLT